MDWKKVGDIYLVKLQPGEELVGKLTQWVQTQNLSGGTVEGLGGICDIELGYFDTTTRSYHRWLNPGNWELVHLWGNLTNKDNQPFWHLHAVISNREGACQAGHLFSAVIAVTAELVIRPWEVIIPRQLDSTNGLYLWNLKD
jgi:predicted DNA-binding protein with PD1-like motif